MIAPPSLHQRHRPVICRGTQLDKPQLSTGNDRLRILDYVPQSVFQSWFNDEYFIGTGSRAAYYDLGTMLMLRGMYRYMMYPSEIERDVSHGGCCYVDIEQDELVFTGVRLYTSRKDLDVESLYLRPWRASPQKSSIQGTSRRWTAISCSSSSFAVQYRRPGRTQGLGQKKWAP